MARSNPVVSRSNIRKLLYIIFFCFDFAGDKIVLYRKREKRTGFEERTPFGWNGVGVYLVFSSQTNLPCPATGTHLNPFSRSCS